MTDEESYGWDWKTDHRDKYSRWDSDSLRGGPLGELYFRIASSEKKIDMIEEKVNNLTIGYTTLKIEMTNVARDEGKLSGIIYGGSGAILTAILIKMIEKVMGS